MPHTYLVPAHARPVSPQPGERLVHSYGDGAAVVEATTAAERPEDAGAVVATAGLRLPPRANRTAVSAARRSIRQALGRPVREDEPDVAAYVEFIAPPDPRWLADVRGSGVVVLGYQPENSYLVRGRRADLAALPGAVRTSEGEPAIRSVTELTGALKTAPPVLAEAGEDAVVVLAATPGERARVVAALRAVAEPVPGAGNDVLDEHRLRVRVRLGAEGLEALLALPLVLSVEPFGDARPEDEVAALVVAGQLDLAGRPRGSYDAWLAAHHVDGAGAVIGIVDGGVDVDHPAFAGRAEDLAGGRKDWHATMVAGHAAGAYRAERDASGFVYGLGTAPAATVLSQDFSRAGRELCGETAARAGRSIAIQNNSWGRRLVHPMDYGSEEALYDAMVRSADGVPLTVCFSSGNSGTAGLTRPKGAKNVIVTGNSENYRPEAGGADSDDVRDLYTGSHPSSHGNCGDGRIRPHVVAPGEWTASAAHGVFPGEVDYVSDLITWGGGSSGASPKTAGACALLAQWWRRWHGGVNPSPAMLRALVVNGAEPIDAGGPIPNSQQGWGRLSLRDLLDPAVARIALDQADLLTGQGETRRFPVRVVDPRRPVKITLAWTDPPGAVGSGTATASPVVNRLALRVRDGGRTWRGGADRFRGGWTAEDGQLTGTVLREEGADNLQCVHLPAGQARSLEVSVTALRLTTDALTGGFDLPRQDFALVITNAEADHGAAGTTVVAGIASGVPVPEPTPDEAAWWAENSSAEPEPAAGQESWHESARTSGSVLEAAGSRLRLVTGATGLAGVAAAVRDGLAGTGEVALLAVPGGTPVTASGVDSLRALAGQADVRVVSDDAGLLARLAGAVGASSRVRYRLADRADALGEAVRDTAVESAGMQRIVLSGAPAGDGVAVSFGVVAADGTLVVVFPARTTAISVRQPGHPDAAPGPGTRVVEHAGRTELVVERAGETPGTWTVRASSAEPMPAGAVRAWVCGGVDLLVEAPEVAQGKRLLRVAAPGSSLRQVSLPRTRLARTPEPDAETDRPLVLRVRPSRVHRAPDEGDPETAARGTPVPALGHVVDVPADESAVLDVPFEVIGVDGDGAAFARRTRAGVVVIGHAQDPPQDPLVRVSARIAEVRYRGGTVTGVRVTGRGRGRELVVRCERLGAAIAAMDTSRVVVLGVRGADLEWVYLPLSASSPKEQQS
ncbi:Subtilase family protein [Lentzea xinjiangensis]|uniref:Subtilase family protein n=1 Tax=Lentzea xinjiangensis TaxID=402600 RepID=A0A1H9K543_9PSEU|nr:S8 family serine peptidase [Lentzea xinjiangensis]SEQ94301.1 Subtilase family protein [Lentzea xinjiangensis]